MRQRREDTMRADPRRLRSILHPSAFILPRRLLHRDRPVLQAGRRRDRLPDERRARAAAGAGRGDAAEGGVRPGGVRVQAVLLLVRQDIAANRFWEAMGFVPLAFRGGRTREGRGGKPRVHIFWQKRIRAGDDDDAVVVPGQDRRAGRCGRTGWCCRSRRAALERRDAGPAAGEPAVGPVVRSGGRERRRGGRSAGGRRTGGRRGEGEAPPAPARAGRSSGPPPRAAGGRPAAASGPTPADARADDGASRATAKRRRKPRAPKRRPTRGSSPPPGSCATGGWSGSTRTGCCGDGGEVRREPGDRGGGRQRKR